MNEEELIKLLDRIDEALRAGHARWFDNDSVQQLSTELRKRLSSDTELVKKIDDLENRSHQTVFFECGCVFKQDGSEAEPQLINHCAAPTSIPDVSEVEVARVIPAANCWSVTVGSLGLKLFSEESDARACCEAINVVINAALHSARQSAIEAAAIAQCEFCQNPDYPKAELNKQGEWVHRDENHGAYCESARIRALASAPESDGWMDIESAPKDRTEILGLRLDAFRRDISICWWSDDFQHWRRYFVAGGEEFTPTHWMPLPSPPKVGDENSEDQG